MRSTLILLGALGLTRGHLERFRSSFGDMRALEADDDGAGTPEGIKTAKKYPYADGTDKYPFFGASHPVETLYNPKQAPEDERPPPPATPIYQTNLYTAAFYGPNTFLAGLPPPHVDTVQLVPPPPPVQWQHPGVAAPYVVPQENVVAHPDPSTVVDAQMGPIVQTNGALFSGNAMQDPAAFSGSYLPYGGLTGGSPLQNGGFVNGNFLQNGDLINRNLLQSGNIMSGNLLQSANLMNGNLLQSGNVADGNFLQSRGFVNGGPLLNGGFVNGNFLQNGGTVLQDGHLVSPGGTEDSKSGVLQTAIADHGGSVPQDAGKIDSKVNHGASIVQNAKVENGGSVSQNAQIVQSGNMLQKTEVKVSDDVLRNARKEESGDVPHDTEPNHGSLDQQHGSTNKDSNVNEEDDTNETWDHNAGFPDSVPDQQNVSIHFGGKHRAHARSLDRVPKATQDVKNVKETQNSKEG